LRLPWSTLVDRPPAAGREDQTVEVLEATGCPLLLSLVPRLEHIGDLGPQRDRTP